MIAIVIGSENDRAKVRNSGMLGILNDCGAEWELSIISAHRNPGELSAYCTNARVRGAKVFVAIAGMAAALAGAIAARSGPVPVIGVPLPSTEFPDAMDALLSMVRMPSDCPVAVSGIGESGLRNAAILALQILSIDNGNAKVASEKLLSWLATSRNNKPAQLLFETGNRND